MAQLVNFKGCRQDSAGIGGDPRLVVNCDLRRFGELRRRRGAGEKRTITGTAAISVVASGRNYLVTFATNTFTTAHLQ